MTSRTQDAETTPELAEKEARLRERLHALAPLAVAFSGGVDSALLLAVAHEELGDGVLAVMACSPLHPRRETEEALAFLEARGIPHRLLRDETLSLPALRANGPDRCYHCKRDLFARLGALAREAGFPHLADGSNASDGTDYRPGTRALRELGVASPLAEAGLAKADLRRLARRLGLPQAEKPSAACLASRVPYGDPLDEALLRRIEAMEDLLHDLGFAVFRARHHGKVLRLELAPAGLARLGGDESLRRRLDAEGRRLGWTWVTLDLGGYRMGSLNEDLPVSESFHDETPPGS